MQFYFRKLWLCVHPLRYTYFMEISRDTVFQILKENDFLSGLDANTLRGISNKAQLLSYKKNRFLYQEGEDADGLYIIFNGSVKIFSATNKHYLILKEGELFGVELGISAKNLRLTNASFEKDTILIKIDPSCLHELILEYPEFFLRLSMAYNSLKLLRSNAFAWIRDGEKIQYIDRQFWIPVFTPILLMVLPLTLLLIVSFWGEGFWGNIAWRIFPFLFAAWILWIISKIYYWLHSFNIISDQRLIFIEKIFFFYDNMQESPLDAILSVTWQTNLLGRLLNFGVIFAKTYTSSLILQNLFHPELTTRILQKIIREKDKEQVLSEKKFLLNYLSKHKTENITDGTQEILKSQREEFEQVPFQETLPLFVTHATIRGTHYYRTHVFLLVKKIFIPSFLFLITSFLLFLWEGSVGIIQAIFAIISTISFLVVLYLMADWHNDLFIVTREQVIDIDRKPLGKEERKSTLIRNIQAIEYKRKGILGLILNFGTVYIRVGESVLTFDNVQDPSRVQREISNYFTLLRNDEKQKTRLENRRLMAESIILYEEMNKDNLDSTAQKPE